VTTIRTMPTERLLAMLPHASGVLRERIESVLKVRFAGTQILPMPCLKITGGTSNELCG
jgi:hypothetical protein